MCYAPFDPLSLTRVVTFLDTRVSELKTDPLFVDELQVQGRSCLTITNRKCILVNNNNNILASTPVPEKCISINGATT